MSIGNTITKNKKICVPLLICLILFSFLSYSYIYIPYLEMKSLAEHKDTIQDLYDSYNNPKATFELYRAISNKVLADSACFERLRDEVMIEKRTLLTYSISLNSQRSKSACSSLIEVANNLETLCEKRKDLEEGLELITSPKYKSQASNAVRKADFEYITKSANEVAACKKNLDEYSVPVMEGYFQN